MFTAVATLAALAVGTSAREARAVTTGQAAPIIPSHSGLCWQPTSNAAGAHVQQMTCTGATNQNWVYESMGDGSYHIKHVDSGLCVDVNGGSTADYANIIVWTCGTQDNQRLTPQENSLGQMGLVAKHSGKCIDTYYAYTTSGVDMIQHPCTGSPQQTFTSVASPAYLGGVIQGSPACTSSDGADLYCFARGSDNRVYVRTRSSNRTWTAWTNAGNQTIIGDPACVSQEAGRYNCFGRAPDNTLVHLYWSNGWNWENFGGSLGSDPDCIARPGSPYGKIDCGMRSSSGTMLYKGWNGTAWTAIQDLGGGFNTKPSCFSGAAANRVDCVHINAIGDMWDRYTLDGGATWADWYKIGTGYKGNTSPSCVGRGTNNYDCFGQGAGGDLRHTWWNPGWTSESLGGGITADPDCVTAGSGDIGCFVRGNDGKIFSRNFLPSTGWQAYYSPQWVMNGPAGCTAGRFNEYNCAAHGTDNAMWTWTAMTGAPPAAPPPPPTVECVYFVHGTGDYTESSARSDYWKQSSLDAMRSNKIYGVAGYKGSAYAADDANSWGDVVNQMGDFINANACTDVVVVTHSNGSNPIRYLLGHGTAMSPALNGRAARQVSSVTSKIRKTIWLAGDNAGTPLADKVTTAGTFGNIASKVLAVLGWNMLTPAVYQQVRSTMATKNSNGVFNGNGFSCGAGSTCGGVPSQYVAGTGVQAGFWDGDAYCGEGGGFFDKIKAYAISVALKATNSYGGMASCGDGFLPCDSQRYNGGGILENGELNHNQSRRDCKSNGGTVAAAVRAAIRADGQIFDYTAVPTDYTVSQAELACDASGAGMMSLRDNPSASFYQNGCPASSRDNGVVNYDCLAAYGYDEGASSNPAVAPIDFSRSEYASNNCPDSWLGDGVCDLCLVAKYGYDALEGTADGADDCTIPDPITLSCTTDAQCNSGVTDPLKYKYFCNAGACQPQSACSDLGADVAGGPITGTYEYWNKH